MPVSPRLIVELFQHVHYRGKKFTIIDSVPDTAKIGANDMISSIKIYKGPGYDIAPNYKVIFCEYHKYRGQKLVLEPGYYPNIHEIPYNFGDVISSIRFTPAVPPTPPQYGAISVILELFEETDFEGARATVMRDVSQMKDISMDSRISSVRIHRGPNFPFSGCQVIFYANTNFEGEQLALRLNQREYRKDIPDLHDYETRFDDIISSIKIAPTGNFNVLVVVGDSRTTEPAILESLSSLEGNNFNYDVIRVNPNPDNAGDPYNAERLAERDLSFYDIIWFTWNAIGHDKEYFIDDAELLIRDFVKRGGIVWTSAMDNINTPEGKWRGGWLPIERYPIAVRDSSDVNVNITEDGHKTGIFTWPNKIEPNALTTDDHWVPKKKRRYKILATRQDNDEPVGIQLRWGEGYYVMLAIDTRDALRSAQAKTFIENALCYLASLAWHTSPRQPLKNGGRQIITAPYLVDGSYREEKRILWN